MSKTVSNTGPGAPGATQRYKKNYWGEENLKFSEPWYRLQKSSRIIASMAAGRECSLLDVGCGPAAMREVLPDNIDYYGIDIAIQEPAPYLKEADLLETPIGFDGKRFDIVIAQGLFEYLGDAQAQKFAEIADLLKPGGKFFVTYTNFRHRKPHIYVSFSNVQSRPEFEASLGKHFTIDRCFPGSHNWRHSQPSRPAIKAVNMRLNANIPVVSPWLAVEYFFICSPRDPRRGA
jgi:SAM-dependent methyltransferase